MADFVAVLRKTIGGLGDTSPEMREKVFDKARATIEAKLAAINPPPPAAVIDRQKQALEEAIAVVRAEFAGPAEPDADDALESILADFDKPASSPAPLPVLAPVASPAPSPIPSPASVPSQAAAAPRAAPAVASETPRDAKPASFGPAATVERETAPAPKRSGDPSVDMLDAPVAADRLAGDAAAPRRRAAAPVSGARKSRTGLLAGVLGLVVLAAAAGGYFWWSGGFGPMVAEGPATPGTEPAATTAGEMAPPPPPPSEQAGSQSAAPTAPEQVAAAPESAPPAGQPSAVDGQEKFTQRLMPDGSEVDEGPSGSSQPGIGEGTSVASAVQPAQPPAPAPAAPQPGEGAAVPPQSAEQPAAPVAPPPEAQQPAPAAPQPAAVAVGQKAIFYEERTSAAEGSAEVGSIAWSLVQESPGGDMPPEPAIRAEATIPGKDVQLRMTIRRNGDKTLPASHIVEMIFLTPEGFDGGSISNVSRIAFKDTEQAPGNPLIGIPAKIADGFFLLALSDAPAETQANLNLLRRQNWLDIPIIYQSGRRALLSMEKGIPGEKVFEDALQAWSQAGSG
jgi:hypothetical protein